MNKQLVRSSYESCLDVTARLNAYATSKPFLGASEINARQDFLATNDLIQFCIHTRRLVDSVGLRDLVLETMIESNLGPMSLSLWKAIGGLIHHDDLLIIRTASGWKMFQAVIAGAHGDEYWERVRPHLKDRPYSEPITPRILFKSDKIPYTLFNLEEFLEVFSTKILPAICESSLDKGLSLMEDLFKDLDMTDEKLAKILGQIDR